MLRLEISLLFRVLRLEISLLVQYVKIGDVLTFSVC